VAATLAWGRRGINLNASVWHLNVSRELLLDLRDSRDVKLVPAPVRGGETGGEGFHLVAIKFLTARDA